MTTCPVQKFSMTGWRYLNVTWISKNPCLVTVTNHEQSSTREHKLKVSTLMMSTRGEVVEGEQGSMLSRAMTDTQASIVALAEAHPEKPPVKGGSSSRRSNR